MIISGLRTSCAMTVDSRPSDDSRSFCDISRWNRAIESVSVLNVVASSRASSSSHRRPRRTILRVRSPVAATSRITSVIVASGRVIVRATAKLRSVASSTATTAVTASSVWIARRKRSCSVRERRISATGAGRRVARDRRRRERQRQRHVLLGAERDVARVAPRGAADRPSAGRSSARQRRREDLAVHAERDLAAGDLLELRGQRIVEQEADAQRAEECPARARGRQHDRHRDELQHPSGCGSRLKLSRPASASRTAGWLATTCAAARRDADRRRAPARPVGDEQQVRVELLPDSRRPTSCTVAGSLVSTAALSFGASAMSRAIIVKVCGARRPELFDERAGRHDLALQRRSRPRGSPDADQVDRPRRSTAPRAARWSGRCGCAARRAVFIGGRSRARWRRRRARSTGCGSEASPSFQATRCRCRAARCRSGSARRRRSSRRTDG